MGRELKRVSLNFKWELNKVWDGYINPYRSEECKRCNSNGNNDETIKIENEWYSWDNVNWIYRKNGSRYNINARCYNLEQFEVDALVDSGRLKDLTHKFVSGEGWIKNESKHYPTAKEVNEWAINSSFGHDAINRWICVEARAKKLGVYGKCEVCNGTGEIWDSEKIKKRHDEWESTEPPSGDGYQLWCTTSEGSPMTPVFETLDELCQYCEDNNVSVFGHDTLTKEEWLKFFGGDDETPLVYTTKEGFNFI